MILSNRIKTDIAVNYTCVIKRLKWKFKYNIDMIYVHIIEKGTTTKTKRSWWEISIKIFGKN